ncbi:hypothetical protein HPB51_021257 [Rhipicephalus microplus]|uniref:carbonic anhydrase n=1 Tax=Rhipicephalus microplus TaxID=6941 RepID=A0A9J6F8L1_RHIMP|nr:hypothetical protein HPB51_021257 [Rhipicephalus microplus]
MSDNRSRFHCPGSGYSGSSARKEFKLNPCTGRRQSPIELSTPRRSEKLQRARADLRMHGYDGPFSQYKVNDTEFGVKLRVLGGLQPSLKGTGLPGRFLLHNLHFHAGLDDSCGSEHTMDGKTFAMEDTPLFLSQMLPGIPPTSYFLYSGSLTLPPYTENVTWMVCTQTLDVTSEALARFRDSASANSKGNIRPTQPIGDRKVILCS